MFVFFCKFTRVKCETFVPSTIAKLFKILRERFTFFPLSTPSTAAEAGEKFISQEVASRERGEEEMSLVEGLIRLGVVTRAARPGVWSFLLSLLRHQRIFPSRRVSKHRHVGLPRVGGKDEE